MLLSACLELEGGREGSWQELEPLDRLEGRRVAL